MNYFLLFSQYERTAETIVATTATPTTTYMSQSITSAKKKLPASAIVARFILCNRIHQRNGTLLHLRGQMLNLRENIVVEEL